MHSVTLEDIHRALEQSEPVEILDHGKVAGTLVPVAAGVARFSERGFPISRGLAHFGTTDVTRIEGEDVASSIPE
jgi:hypothetical protein